MTLPADKPAPPVTLTDPDMMSQDISKPLGQWFASRLSAREDVRRAVTLPADVAPRDQGARRLLALAQKDAVLSACGRFRYHLSRHWGPGPVLLYVMLNPSTADASIDDATIRRCATFAWAHGFGGFEVVNLWAYRSTDPKALRAAGYLVGPDNDWHIARSAERCDAICVAWGTNAAGLARPGEVLLLLQQYGAKPLQCLAVTRGGHPGHPLMLASSCRLQPFGEAR